MLAELKKAHKAVHTLEHLSPHVLIAKVGKNLLFHGDRVVHDLGKIFNAHKSNDWQLMGNCLGELILDLAMR